MYVLGSVMKEQERMNELVDPGCNATHAPSLRYQLYDDASRAFL